MSEQQPVNFDQYIDWSQGDLLDACYDSMRMDMGHESLEWRCNASNFSSQAVGMTNQHPTTTFSETCQVCGEIFGGYEWESRRELDNHAKSTEHQAWGCPVNGCDLLFPTFQERKAHEKRPHVVGHKRILTSGPYDCIECEESLTSKANLLRHAKEQQHQPYGCECGALFSRLDVLNRHLEAFDENEPKYPCLKCRRHQGADGFRRRDHLTQHMRNYHHLEQGEGVEGATSRMKYTFPTCPHIECPKYRDELFKTLPRSVQQQNKPFSSQSAYTKHMRDEHDECSFPCDIAGCSRVGRRGYFREKDLLKHRRDQHEDAPPYQVTQRELRIQCTEPSCARRVSHGTPLCL